MKMTLWLPLIAAALVVSFPQALRAGPQDKRLDVYWVDVEGGAATLVVTPAGETVLVDTGNPGRRDPGRIVKTVTEVAGARRIDHLIITHYHRDHYGGAVALSNLLPIGKVYDNGVFDGMPDNPGEAYFSFKCEKRIIVQPGDAVNLAAAEGAAPATLKFLGTRRKFIAAPDDAAENTKICAQHKPKDRDGSDNANSVVMLFGFGPFRFFDGGDLTWNQEQKLVCPSNLVGKVDVYQVGHHGLASSNNPVLLHTLQPKVAVMNNGVTKGSSPSTFAALRSTDALEAIYQMHKNLRPDRSVNNTQDELIANLPKECEANYIKLSVDPAGKTYTVSIPATGHKRTFQTK